MPADIVIRIWAFQNFFVSDGTFDWTNLDQVLTIAAAHGDKVIPVLANQYDYCDGPAKDLAWFQHGYKTTVAPGDITTYRKYVADHCAALRRQSDHRHVAIWSTRVRPSTVTASCNEPAALSALGELLQ